MWVTGLDRFMKYSWLTGIYTQPVKIPKRYILQSRGNVEGV